ncbi:aminoglycoside N(3)-acetyltransferase [Paenibacillus wulumuqiensis]|uniref:aminoglycoside N(3)-acetyltransferase n=1 Tax=Paenibacillus wulumuqiensis TaxID=1567107 RepID=UPI000619C824|nr:AAC(3) family N-acetyltransferase [Paenibacillus wulumuqiensis]
MISERPISFDQLTAEFRALGVTAGMNILLHSSLKSIGGWIPGGAETVILALEHVLGEEGTLMVPTQTSQLTHPKLWKYPPADPKWWDLICESTPAYDPDFTVPTGMGVIVETFRKQRGVIRSSHPHVSFAARGPYAREWMADHGLDYGLGSDSPLQKLYDADGHVLMLGTDYLTNTSIHLAEFMADWNGKKQIEMNAPVMTESGKQWITFKDLNFDSDDFDRIGSDFEEDCPHLWKQGKMGQADARLLSQQGLVDYAVGWLETHR